MSKQEIPRATHTGEIEIGETVIPCAVLSDGTRLLTQRGFLKAIGRSDQLRGGQAFRGDGLPPFIAANNLKPFISNDLIATTQPIVFQTEKGIRANGYKAELLPRVCEVYLRAHDSGALLKTQENIMRSCYLLMRGLAHVGITALVDEATGYQADRARDALEQILNEFIAKEHRKWIKTFPDEFYEEMFRLRGWPYDPFSVKRP